MSLLGCGAAALAAVSPTTVPATQPAAQLTKQQIEFFEGRVRPILAANCYRCHSVESGKSKGGLVLDTRDGWVKGGENGSVITPGDVAHSRLITAIGYHDADLQMPPKGGKLSDKEIADLTAWVKMGAPDPRVAVASAGSKMTGLNDTARAHWAYQPVKQPAVPEVKNASWVKSPVDAFILAKLEENGMRPSPPASKQTLIRRATYDLIGLPPTPEEVKGFEQDGSPNAFEKVIDRLLATPQYGERWGRFWLDSARYSDTTGAENGNLKGGDYRYAHAWTYRDYVIQSFNEDEPYDQFLKEQLAADHLDICTQDPTRLAALGFITLGKRFGNPNDQIDEHIDTLGKAMQGITIACARCHDHKFDPISQADYYALHGIFASTIEPKEKPVVAKPPDEKAYADYCQKLAALQKQNLDNYFALAQEKGDEFRSKAQGYLLVVAASRKQDRDNLLNRDKLIKEFNLNREIYQQFRPRPETISVLGPLMRFADVPEDQFAAKAPAILAEITAGRIGMGQGNKFGRQVQVNPLVAAAFKEVSPESLKNLRDVASVYAKLFESVAPKAKAFVEANRAATEDKVSGIEPALVELLQIPAPVHPASELASDDQLKVALQELPQQNGNAYRKFTFTEINELQLTHPGAPSVAMVVADAPQPRNSPIFIRGEAQSRGPIQPHQYLAILSGSDHKPFTKTASGRLELAEAIASKNNPLTPRVAMNRLWMHHFGEAFVRTPDDLGVMSEPPSHPELLDYLASRFMEGGWSFKKMHKLVMLSSAYQQSSDTNAAYAAKDSENRLLWRANLRRLDFEAIRDTMLLLTGKIDLTVGGKPVNLTDEPYSYRRSVYGYVDRGQLPELMAQFDFADPDMANSRRATTIVPAQALFFMNSPMSVDVARKITSREEFTKAHDDAGRVRAIYQVLFQRAPRGEEIRLAVQFVASEQGSIQSSPSLADARAKQRFAQKPNPAATNKRNGDARKAVQNQGDYVERKPLTPWELYTQALLFTNELAYVN
jgi:cytochrome c553